MHEKLGNRKSGHTSCPATLLTHMPHEPYTSVPGDDERVSCHECGRVTSEIAHELRAPVLELPDRIQKVMLELISWDFSSDEKGVGVYRVFRIGQKGLFQDPPTGSDHQRAAMAVAQGHAQTLLDEAERMDILFSLSTVDRNDRIKLSYLPRDVDDMDDTPVDFTTGDASAILTNRRVSEERAKAVRGLMRQGFKLVVADLESMMPRILLRNCSKDTGYGGVTAEFTWLD